MPSQQPIINVFFDKEDKTYYPGDTVTGTVLLENTVPLSARSISIGSSGRCETWNVTAFEPNCKKYLFSGSEMVWCSDGSKNELEAGKHEFPFSFNLPAECPPSFKGMFGQNLYKVVVFIDIPWKFTAKIPEEFVVSKKLDLPAKMWPNPMKLTGWFYKSIIQAGLIFKEGPVTLKVSMPSLVFMPGETIDLNFQVVNGSSVEVKKICAKFCERTHFHSRHQHTPCSEFGFHSCPLGYFGQEFTTRKLGHRASMVVSVPPRSTKCFTLPFTIPIDAKTPSFESGLITHGYLFELGIQVEKTLLAQYMTAKVYIGERKDDGTEGEDMTEFSKKLAEALEDVPPPSYQQSLYPYYE